MADVDMAVSTLTRVTGIPDIENDTNVVDGDDGTPYYFPNDGMTLLAFQAGAAAGTTITFTGYADEYGRVATSFTFIVAAGNTGLVGPFDPHLWNDSDGRVKFTIGAADATDHYLAIRLQNTGTNGV